MAKAQVIFRVTAYSSCWAKNKEAGLTAAFKLRQLGYFLICWSFTTISPLSPSSGVSSVLGTLESSSRLSLCPSQATEFFIFKSGSRAQLVFNCLPWLDAQFAFLVPCAPCCCPNYISVTLAFLDAAQPHPERSLSVKASFPEAAGAGPLLKQLILTLSSSRGPRSETHGLRRC